MEVLSSGKTNVGFLYFKDPNDVKAWSGTISHLHSTIKSSEDLNVKDIVVEPSSITRYLRKLIRIISFDRSSFSLLMSKFDEKKANKLIEESGCDVIFAPACSTLIYAGRKALKNKRLFYMSDATYHKMLGYYFNHSKHDQRIGNTWEKNAQDMSECYIIPANWAADDAVSYYGTPESKIKILKFGANLEDCGYKVVESNKSVYKLLLVGVDWERKGIDIAIDCVRKLNGDKDAPNFELSIVGVSKQTTGYPDYIHFYGRLNKDKPEEFAKLIECYQTHDIFIMPTKAECAGIVFAEAAMFGLPSFTYDTGGVSDYVEDGVTGRCLSRTSTSDDFKNAIKDSITSGEITNYSINARKKYEAELNWNVFREKFEKLVKEK